LDKYLKLWKKRKKNLGKGCIDQITEQREISNDTFMEELGLENDPIDIKTIGNL